MTPMATRRTLWIGALSSLVVAGLLSTAIANLPDQTPPGFRMATSHYGDRAVYVETIFNQTWRGPEVESLPYVAAYVHEVTGPVVQSSAARKAAPVLSVETTRFTYRLPNLLPDPSCFTEAAPPFVEGDEGTEGELAVFTMSPHRDGCPDPESRHGFYPEAGFMNRVWIRQADRVGVQEDYASGGIYEESHFAEFNLTDRPSPLSFAKFQGSILHAGQHLASTSETSNGSASFSSRTFVESLARVNGEPGIVIVQEESWDRQDLGHQDGATKWVRVKGTSIVREWFVASHPYPVVTEIWDQGRWGSDEWSSHSRLLLTRLEVGPVEVPWGPPGDADGWGRPFAAEHAFSRAGMPVANGLPMTSPQAIVAAADAASGLEPFHRWKAEHASARVVGFLWGPQSAVVPQQTWRVLWATPEGAGYEVWAVEEQGGLRWNVSGERALPPLSHAELDQPLLDLDSAAQAWRERAPQNLSAKGPNYVAWGLTGWRPASLPFAPHGNCHFDYFPWELSLEGIVDGYASRLEVGRYETAGCPDVDDLALVHRVAVLNVDAVNGTEARYVASDDGEPELARPFFLDGEEATAIEEILPEGLQPPRLEIVAFAATSLFAIFLATYFSPLVKVVAFKGLALVPGYSKLKRSELLDQHVRDRLAQVIEADPGRNMSELAAAAEVGWGTAVHHLGVLENHKLVTSLVDGRHRRYFPAGTINWSDRGRIAALRYPKAQEIVAVVTARPGITQGELLEAAGLTRGGGAWHLKRLQEANVITPRREGRAVRYFAAASPASSQAAHPAVESAA